ncbi:LPP20 family lipoprotein [Sulfurimonas sp.]
MKKTVIILTLLLGIVLSGCGSTKRVEIAQKQLPSWYENPPQSTSGELYAVGEGKTKKEAIDNALSLLASTLSVSISSSFNAKTIIKEGTINSSDATYVNQTQSNVKKITITNYKLLNAVKLGFKRFVVLVKTDKKELFNGLKNEINQEFTIIKESEKNLKNSNALKKLAFYKESINRTKNIPNNLIVMKALNANFNSAEYLKQLNQLQTQYDYYLSHITFSVNVASNAKGLVASIVKGLNDKKIQVKNVKNKMHFTVFINININKTQAYGFSIARSDLYFTTKDFQNTMMASNVVHIDGQSSQGYQIAVQNVYKKLDLLIAKEGIGKVLGLNI